MENTRIRGRNQPSLLDLVITSDEESIFDVALLAPLRKSDHTVITIKYNYIIHNQNNGGDARINYFRTDYEKMQKELDLELEVLLSGLSVSDGWTLF